ALHLRRGTLMIGSAALSQLVLIVWTSHTDAAPWPNIALAAACAVAAYTALTAFGAARKRDTDAKPFLIPCAVALLLGHVVAWGAGVSADTPLFTTLLLAQLLLAIGTLALAW